MPSDSNLARVSLSLPQAIAELATDLAAREQRSYSSLLAFAIESWIHANYRQRLEAYGHLAPRHGAADE